MGGGRPRTGWASTMVAALVLAVGGCGDDDSTESSSTVADAPPPAAAPEQSSSGGSPSVNSPQGGTDADKQGQGADDAANESGPTVAPAPAADPEQVRNYADCLRKNGFVPPLKLLAEVRKKARDVASSQSSQPASEAEPVEIPESKRRKNQQALAKCQGVLPEAYAQVGSDPDRDPSAVTDAVDAQGCFGEALDAGAEPAEAAEECGLFDPDAAGPQGPPTGPG